MAVFVEDQLPNFMVGHVTTVVSLERLEYISFI